MSNNAENICKVGKKALSLQRQFTKSHYSLCSSLALRAAPARVKQR